MTTIYPKTNGDKVNVAEYNCVKCFADSNKNTLETELENSMNITKLQFCKNISDIPHDYLLVDSFTDSSGYNNSVCITNTTSSYVSSGLTGYYIGLTSCNPTSCVLCNCGDPVDPWGSNSGNFWGYSCSSSGSYSNIIICAIPGCISLTGVKKFVLINCYTLLNSCGNAVVIVTCSNDNKTVCSSCVDCLLYCCVCSNCYDFYCNGICKCQVTLAAFPSLTYRMCTNTPMSYNCACSLVCVRYLYSCTASNKIMTMPVCFSCPIKMVYYTDETYGSGTRVYNVINASTGCCIATNVPVNSFCLLGCCVCCHVYEIIQCADDVSCIKSYAIATGV
jgi:hypothetical protein